MIDRRGNNYQVLIDYLKLHGPWNKNKKGLQVAWNKGLTKENDNRVKKYSLNTSKSKKGVKLSDKQKEKIRQKLKGRPAPNKGIPCSEQTKEKLRKLLSGSKNPFYGKKHSFETKIKISLSRKGKKNPNYLGFNMEDYKKDIINLYLNNNSAKKIGEKYGISDVTIINYLRKWKITIRRGMYNFKGLILCKDGHKVRSYPELEIDNFLFSNGILHEVEKSFYLKNKRFKCDFYLPESNAYIEYWGIYHNHNYLKRKEIKLKAYKDVKLNLISIEWNENPINKLKPLIPQYSTKQKNLFNY